MEAYFYLMDFQIDPYHNRLWPERNHKIGRSVETLGLITPSQNLDRNDILGVFFNDFIDVKL